MKKVQSLAHEAFSEIIGRRSVDPAGGHGHGVPVLNVIVKPRAVKERESAGGCVDDGLRVLCPLRLELRDGQFRRNGCQTELHTVVVFEALERYEDDLHRLSPPGFQLVVPATPEVGVRFRKFQKFHAVDRGGLLYMILLSVILPG